MRSPMELAATISASRALRRAATEIPSCFSAKAWFSQSLLVFRVRNAILTNSKLWNKVRRSRKRERQL